MAEKLADLVGWGVLSIHCIISKLSLEIFKIEKIWKPEIS